MSIVGQKGKKFWIIGFLILCLLLVLLPGTAYAASLSTVQAGDSNNYSYFLPDSEGDYAVYPLTSINVKVYLNFDTTISSLATNPDSSSVITLVQTGSSDTPASVYSATFSGSRLTVTLNTTAALTRGTSYTVTIPAGAVTLSDGTWPEQETTIEVMPSLISSIVATISSVAPSGPQITPTSAGVLPSIGYDQPQFTLTFGCYPDMVDGKGYGDEAKLDDLAQYFELVDETTATVTTLDGDNFEYIIKSNPYVVEPQKLKVRLPQMTLGDRYTLRIKEGIPYYTDSAYENLSSSGEAVNLISFNTVDMDVTGYTIDGSAPADPANISDVSLYPIFALSLSQPISYNSTKYLAQFVDVAGVQDDVNAYIWYSGWSSPTSGTNYQSSSITIKPFTYLVPGTTYKLVLPSELADCYGAYLGEDKIVATFTTTSADFDGRSFDNPIEISTAEDLFHIRDIPDWEKKFYVLTADIDLDDLVNSTAYPFGMSSATDYKYGMTSLTTHSFTSASTANWTPFTDTKMFIGGIDGKGYKIKNMTIASSSSGVGLFAFLGISAKASYLPSYSTGAYQIETQIKNIIFSDVNIATTGNKGSGALAALCGSNYVNISNCQLISGNDTDSDGVVDGNSSKGTKYVGGLVGQGGPGTAFSDCSVSDTTIMGHNLSATNNTYFGGLAGIIDYNSTQPGALDKSETTGCSVSDLKITANCNIGGLFGAVLNGSSVTDCSVDNAVIKATCYSATVDYDAVVGGLIGKTNGSIYDSSVADTDIYGLSYLGGLVGKSYSQLYFSNLNPDCLQTEIIGCDVDNVNIYSTNSGIDTLGGANLAKPTTNAGYNKYIGGLLAFSMGVNISDCTVTDCDVDGLKYVGGLIGYGERYYYNSLGADTVSGMDTSISGCTVSNSTVSLPDYTGITFTNDITGYDIGGFAGYLCYTLGDDDYDGVNVANCSVDNVPVSGLSYVGGFVGKNEGVIDDCDVIGGSATLVSTIFDAGYASRPTIVGGFAADNSGEISDSATTAKVYWSDDDSDDANANYAGAFIGKDSSGSYSNCRYLTPFVMATDEDIVAQPEGISEDTGAVAPVITNDLTDVSTTAGVGITLDASATVTDAGTVSYAWYSNTSDSAVGGTALNVTTATYSPDVNTAGTYYYYCIVTNTNDESLLTTPATTTSAVSTVTVLAAPTVVSTAVTNDGNVSITFSKEITNPGIASEFTVTVDGEPVGVSGVALAGQVTKIKLTLAAPITDGNQMVTVAYTKDAAAANQVAAADGSVLATFGAQTVTNGLVNAVAPLITIALSDKTTDVGTAVTLDATSTVSDGGTVSYAWYSNTSASTVGGTALDVTTATYSPDVNTAGTCYYYCIVTNTNNAATGVKTATTSAVSKVTVNALVNAVAPVITTALTDKTTTVGTAVTLDATATVSDAGTVSYAWYSNTSASTVGGTSLNVTTATYSPNVSIDGTYYYYCVLTNTNNAATGAKTATTTSAVSKVTVNAASGGGSSSSGGISATPTTGDSGSSTNTTGNTVTTTTTISSVTGSDGKASCAVTGNQINTAISEIAAKSTQDNVTSVIKIDVKADNSAKSVETTIPKAALGDVADSNIQYLTLSNPIAAITFDQNTLAGISNAASGDVNITASNVDVNTLSESIQEKVGDHPVYNFSVTSGNNTISQFSGSVSVEIPYKLADGEDANDVVIYYINASGALEIVQNCYYDEESGKIKFNTDHFSRYAVGYNEVSFSDVSGWCKDYVNYLAARGIITGSGEGKFAPSANITRAEFAQILANMSGADLSSYISSSFSDVNTSAWYSKAVAWAYAEGIVLGADGKFNPNACITRQDIALMLARYAEKIAKTTLDETVNAVTFADQSKISAYAKAAVSTMQQAGIIGGRSNNTFDPQANATRAEASKMIALLLQNIIGGFTSANNAASV